MPTKKRPAPSFRPNLKLSHFVYRGPEERHYDTHGQVSDEATGTRVIAPSNDRHNKNGSAKRKGQG